MKFSKDKMVARLTKAGLADQITPDVIKIMDNLNGQQATASCWLRVVHGEPVYWVVGKDGHGEYVNEADCL